MITIIKGIIEDIKFIFKAIGKIRRGEKIIDQEKKDLLMKELFGNPKQLMKELAPYIMVALFAMSMGWLLTAKYYQLQCNNFIMENYDMGESGLSPKSPLVTQLPSYDSEEYSDYKKQDQNTQVNPFGQTIP